jgi:phosphopantetheinyl transferase (holo-ACP synthase)
MRIVPLPQSWSGRALVVFDVADLESWFSPGELATVDSFRLEKRRREWMLSRIAEKELRRRGATGAHVSFSHSGRYGAAAVDERPAGIDVEMAREISPQAAHLFLTDEEAATANRSAISNPLLHFWSAKEARWKQLGGSIATLKGVPLVLLREEERGLTFAGVETFTVEDLVVALTTDNRQPTTRA